ncbi:hypothetical protein EHI45_13500 [Rhizobium leguminosarum]|uniref:hypothetical protein n=1 Tax=Rhizobium leguminosarum TaxID=384 RepID=UPI000FEC420D|nr:hypothetical protein [Rhizobium leguminosarum]RWX14297.1 hypothetical protein EHI45_13500 [Rhizobium leguminosarum]
MINQAPYHPRRYEVLVGKMLRREFLVNLETMRLMKVGGQDQRPVIRAQLMAKEFATMTSGEIFASQRREAALAKVVRDWREYGSLTFDFSESLHAEPLGTESDFPQLDILPRSFFINFGEQCELAISGGGFLDGAYVITCPDDGPGYMRLAFVSSPQADRLVESLGDILSVQSCAAIGFSGGTTKTTVDLNDIDTDYKLRPLIPTASICLGMAFSRIATRYQPHRDGPQGGYRIDAIGVRR